jgi:hypothetical protein
MSLIASSSDHSPSFLPHHPKNKRGESRACAGGTLAEHSALDPYSARDPESIFNARMDPDFVRTTVQ